MPPSNQMTLKRIRRELADLQKDEAELGAIELGLVSDANLYVWKGTIPGPEGSPYEGGVFRVDIKLPDDYPFNAPKVTFATRIYHMNISETGSICIDILKSSWSPALSLFKLMLSLSSLLTDPNPKDPLVPSIATAYVRDRAKHDETARHWTKLYAQSRGPDDPEPPQAPTPIANLVRRMIPHPMPLAYPYPPPAGQNLAHPEMAMYHTHRPQQHYYASAPSYYMPPMPLPVPARGRQATTHSNPMPASSSSSTTPSSSRPRAGAAPTRARREVITISDSDDDDPLMLSPVASPRRAGGGRSSASMLAKRRRGESESEVEGLVLDADRGVGDERRVRRRNSVVRPPPDSEIIVID